MKLIVKAAPKVGSVVVLVWKYHKDSVNKDFTVQGVQLTDNSIPVRKVTNVHLAHQPPFPVLPASTKTKNDNGIVSNVLQGTTVTTAPAQLSTTHNSNALQDITVHKVLSTVTNTSVHLELLTIKQEMTRSVIVEIVLEDLPVMTGAFRNLDRKSVV